jgi:hypothetical protein
MTSSNIRFPGPVRRIRVAWRNGQWRIQKQVKISSMTLPPSGNLPTQARRSGFWIEAVDRNGQMLYRKIMDDPTESIEVVGDRGSFTRIPVIDEEITFDVLVPDRAGLRELRFFSSHRRGDEAARATQQTIAELVAVLNIEDAEDEMEDSSDGN